MKLKIISWNIWQGAYLKEVKYFLKDADADIIALQEVSDDERGNIAEGIAEYLGYEYTSSLTMKLPAKYFPIELKRDTDSIPYGNAILTKHRIVDSESILLTEEDQRTITKADIKIGEHILHVFSLHLRHTHQQPSNLQNMQTDILVEQIPEKNAIVMGDFNALSESYPIKKMSEILQNAEISSATPTWSMYKEGCTHCQIGELKHKLDYIFTTRDIEIISYGAENSAASDHLPIVATIAI